MGPKENPLSLSARLSAFAVLITFLYTASPAWAAPPGGYNLVWSDEFNGTAGSAPNPANWTYDTGAGGWGNNELENYTTSTNNSQIIADPNATDGKALALIAVDTQPGSTNYGAVGRYTSARLLTSGLQSFQYGYMEARIQMPYGDGIWPAFWMLGNNIGSVGWPACGEMDIMENIGNAADQPLNHGSLHAPNWNPTETYSLPGGALYHNAYHTFGLLWQQDQVQFYVDGVLFETQTSAGCVGAGGTYEFNSPFFFLLNMAVGGSWPGAPDSSTSFPQTMLVDYVRVYQQPAGTLTPTPTPVVASTWRVNAGASQYTDSQGNVWSADENYAGGTAAVTTSAITGALPGAGDQTLYQSQRYGSPFSYVFNVPAGSYQVTLKFAETYWTAVGDRVFNVSINGNTVLTNFDLFKTAGGQNKAIDEVFNSIAPSGGAITIQFGPATADNAMVDAIQIIPEPSTPTETPTKTYTFTQTATMSPTGTSTVTNTLTLTKTATPTSTASPTATLTSTRTQTSSPTPSFTTLPPTATFTLTVTSTKTNTGTPTFTSTNTLTHTPVPPSVTNTPLPLTATSTRTQTSSPTETPTKTYSFTQTATMSPMGTPSPSVTPSKTDTFTLTSTPNSPFLTPTFTLTLTSTPTSTFTASATASNTPTITNTSSWSPTTSPTQTPTHTPSATASQSPTNTFMFTGTATMTSTKTLTPLPTMTWTSTWTYTATQTPTPTKTSTAISSPTSTATAQVTIGIPVPFPNPVMGPGPAKVEVSLQKPAAWLKLKIYTLAFRLVNEENFENVPAGPNDFPLALTGKGGVALANGLYYLEVTTPQGHSMGKWLILR